MKVLVTIGDDGLVQTPWGLWRVIRMEGAAVLRKQGTMDAALVVLTPHDAKAELHSKPHMQRDLFDDPVVNRKRALKVVSRLRRRR